MNAKTKGKGAMLTPRRRSRRFVVQALYQALLNPDESADSIARHIRDNDLFVKADDVLFSRLFQGAFANRDVYMQQIAPLLDRNEEELSPVERAVLLMAAHELTAMPETPYPVIINEAVEIAKTFGGTDGYKFVNGILDKLAVQLRPDDPPRH